MSLIPKKGTVYVVDDDEAVRDSLQWLLEGKDYRVRCFDSAESFLSRYDPREVACLIVDIRMGGMTGLELQDRLIERKSPLPVVFITGHGDVPMAVNTMKKGAMDFIQKPFKEDELVSLVERMLEHARGAFAEYQSAASRDALLSKLTSREAQVLERIVAGRLNKQIADDLGISIKTVEAHRANIMEKLNANTVADLLKIALGQNAPKADALQRNARLALRAPHDRQLIDGNALARKIRAEVAGRTAALEGQGRAAARWPSSWSATIRPARSTCGTRSTTATRPACSSMLERYPADMTEARPAGAHQRAQRRPARPRHPGAAAAAQAHRRPQGDRDHLAGQGRRRLPRGQRRRADGRPARLLALHALRLHEDDREHRRTTCAASTRW